MIKNNTHTPWPKGIPAYKSSEYMLWANYKHLSHLSKGMDFESFWIEYGDHIAAGLELRWNGTELEPASSSDRVSLGKRSDIKYQGVYLDKRRNSYYWQVFKGGKYQGMKGGYADDFAAAYDREIFIIENDIVAFRNLPNNF